MTLKRSSLFLMMLLTILALGASQLLAAPVLIKLHLKDLSDYQKAKDLNVLAYHRFNNLFIVEFENEKLEALDDANLTYQIIDEKPWSESYYVISESERFEKVDLSGYGEILMQEGKFYFLKISDHGAQSLAEKGYHIAKVFHRPIPLKFKPAIEKLHKDFLFDPSIDSLLSLVSEDSLYVWDLRLQDFQTRYSYSDSIHSARQWLFDKFINFGIDSVWFHHYYYDSDQYNVVATVVGTALPDKVIVVGGHYDSVVYGAGTNPYVWAPGADDNASGTAATMEIARIIAQNPLPVTVIFVPFAQEEQGLVGSDYFAEYLHDQGTDLHLMLNADMIGHSVDADTDVVIYAASTAMEFVNLMMDMANTYTHLSPYYGGQSGGSDHYPFYQWGYDALFASEGDFFINGWHKNYDIVDSLDFDYMKEVVKMELATLITVASSFAPQYVCGDVNQDEAINLSDPMCLASYYFGNACPVNPQASDVDCDTLADLGDAIIIANVYFGIPGFELNCCD